MSLAHAMRAVEIRSGLLVEFPHPGISTILGVPRIVLVCGETPGSRPKLVEGSVFEPTEFLPHTCVGIYAN